MPSFKKAKNSDALVVFSCYLLSFSLLQALLFGGNDRLPVFLARQTLPGLDIVVDPCAAILVLIVTALLCVGIKEVC